MGSVVGTVVVLIVVLFSVWIISRPERGTTGSVNTKFRLLGPDDKIVVDGFDDPKVEGVACHISRAFGGQSLAAARSGPRPLRRAGDIARRRTEL